ncbi:MAG TPA: hypothetical protein PLM07_12825 [Candidatus Rifleibacterium sp.]|mgnify:CR=1 FL=1|nr:hypothetical protein [Candidatus Rifleibacterium sp.]HPT46767.1 hypothetical protein [Candidatus Rifleibacterium sp.]
MKITDWQKRASPGHNNPLISVLRCRARQFAEGKSLKQHFRANQQHCRHFYGGEEIAKYTVTLQSYPILCSKSNSPRIVVRDFQKGHIRTKNYHNFWGKTKMVQAG